MLAGPNPSVPMAAGDLMAHSHWCCGNVIQRAHVTVRPSHSSQTDPFSLPALHPPRKIRQHSYTEPTPAQLVIKVFSV